MDLNDAIAELQGKGDWFADEFDDFDERLRSPLATILNAVLSGALIPRPAANGWRPMETAPRDGTWFRARTEHGTERVVHFADEADRYPISHDGEAWSTAPVEWTPVAPRPAEPAQAAQVDLVAKLPRLTEAMIIAACKAHYGSKIVDQLGIDGIDLATEAREYTFRDGFKRMWSGVRAVIRAEAAEAALAAMTEREERLCRSLRHYMDLAHTGGTEADWFEAHDGATAALTQKGA